MFDRILEASNNYFKQFYPEFPSSVEDFKSQDFFVSKIEAINDEFKKEIYFFLDMSLIKEVYFFMVGDFEVSQEELKDFSCEIANLIVGSAKVLAQDDVDVFKISTPIFVSHATDIVSNDYDKSASFSINEKLFSIKARYL